MTLQQIQAAFRDGLYKITLHARQQMIDREIYLEDIKRKSKETCDYCGGTLYPQIVNLEFRVKGELIMIEEVPADVCNRCGEKYLSAEVDAGVERLLQNEPQAQKIITVPVFKWRSVEP